MTDRVPARASDPGRAGDEDRTLSGEFLDLVIEHIPHALLITDDKGATIRRNRACRELMNVTDERLATYNILEDAVLIEQGYQPLIRRVYENGEEVHFTLEPALMDPDGVRLDAEAAPMIDCTVSPIKDRDGRVVNAVIQAIDVTSREKTLLDLRDSQQRLQALFQTSPTGIFITRRDDGTVIDANDAFIRLLGMDRGDVIGSTTIELGLFADREARERTLLDERLDGVMRDTEVVLTTKQGERTVLISGAMMELAGDRCLVGTVTDITERKMAEEALKASEEGYRRIVETASEGVWVIDADHRTTFGNAQLAEMFGYPVEEMMGRTVESFVVEDEVEAQVREFQRRHTGVPGRYERHFRRKDGSDFWVVISGTPLMGEDGTFKGSFGMVTDITDRKRAEEALERRVLALTRPLDDAAGIAFEDLFNVDDMQRLQDEFSRAWGVAALITRPDGTPITRQSGFTEFCRDFVRKNDKGSERCRMSDAVLGRHSTSGPTIRNCLSAGLCGAGASITVGGRHVASWLIGQVRNETENDEQILAYARELGVDEAAFREAYLKVPVMSQERFEQIAHALFSLSNQLSTIAYQNTQQARFINERNQALEALDSLSRLQSVILDNSTVGITFVRRRVFEWVNPKMAELFDLPLDQIQGASTRIVYLDDESYERLGAEYYPVLAAGGTATVEAEMRRGDGSSFWCRLDGTALDASRHDEGSIWIWEDITERKEAEEALRASEERYRRVVETASEGIWMIDADHRTTFVNAQMAQMLGYSVEEMIGQAHELFVFPEDLEDNRREMDRRAEGRPSTYERRWVRRDGTVIWTTVSAVPMLNADGSLMGSFGMITDITERKAVEDELYRLTQELERRVEERTAELRESNAELESFSYSVSHDLRAPLRHISAQAGMLAGKYGDVLDEKGRERIASLSRSVHQMGVLIDELLEFSRAGRVALTMTRVDMLELVEEVQRGLESDCEGRDIEWVVHDLPSAWGDKTMLRQVWANLLGNAVKYTRPCEHTVITIDAWETPTEQEFTVTDNGIGFEMQYADKLFGVFQRLQADPRFEGVGIGLANVRRIVSRHGGRTWGHGALDAGATFGFSLPKKGAE